MEFSHPSSLTRGEEDRGGEFPLFLTDWYASEMYNTRPS